MKVAAEILLVMGAALTLIAAIGVNRFRDVLARMHALSKATTLGLVFVLIGTTLGVGDANSATFAALAVTLQLLTSPVASNLMARATYRAEGIPTSIDVDDEYATARAARTARTAAVERQAQAAEAAEAAEPEPHEEPDEPRS